MTNVSEPDPEESEQASGPTPKEIGLFVLRAPRRRRGLAVLAFALAATGGVGVAMVKPPAYISEVRILAQRNASTVQAIATRATRDEAPTKSAPDIILQRDNLIGIVQDLDLVERWNTERPPALRLKDRVIFALFGAPKEDDMLHGLVATMEKKLIVYSDENTVTINVEWSNPRTAFDIASLAQKRFFDARHDAEIGMITDAIAILDAYVISERDKMNQAIQELQGLEDDKRRGVTSEPAEAAPSSAPSARPAPRKTVMRPPPPPPVAPPDPELKKALETKKRRIAELQDEHTRRLNELNAQLADLRTTLAPAHPSVLALEMKLEAAKDLPPELIQLRIEEKAIVDQMAAAEVRDAPVRPPPPPPGVDAPATHPDAGSPLVVVAERPDDDAATVVAKTKLQNATLKYDELTSRIRAAKIELDAAQAAFKYKYTVVKPAEVPRDPKKPSPALFGLAGFVAAFVLYFLVPALADLASGRIIASWQARKLGIPLLGEVDAPDKV